MREPSPGTGLGGRLIAAREAQGLTLDDVAQELRLPAATLEALETGRFEDLPEPIFVRGYLRAYARLLEMDEEALIAEYDRLVVTPEPEITPTTKVRRQATARDPFIRGATAVIVVAMVVLLGSWWYARLVHDVPSQSQTASSQAEVQSGSQAESTSPAPVLPPPQIETASRQSEPVAAPVSDIPPESPASEAVEESVAAVEPESPMTETDVPAEAALPLVSEPPVTANADAVAQRPDVEATAESAVPNLPIAPLASEHGRIVRASRAPTGEDVLVIKANGESWAEVVDANGYQLLYYLLRPGMVRRMQGQAPFKVTLGYAPAIDLSLNQERFDHTPFHRRNGTARFSVDDAS
jgi:cytoskeleton protein RodZ